MSPSRSPASICRNVVATVVATLCFHAGAGEVAQAAQASACASNPSAMSAFAGRYANAALLSQVAATRRWQWTADVGDATELSVSKNGRVELIHAWHEAGTLGKSPDSLGDGCLTRQDSGVLLSWASAGKAPMTISFVRIPATSPREADAPYFNILFRGDFLDEEGKVWRFSTKKVSVDGRVRDAELMLDRSELPEGGAVLRLRGEDLLWVFEPLTGGGWAVLRSDWASAPGYVPPSLSKPWRTLTPKR